MPVYPVSDDDHIGAALNVARNPDPMGDAIQAKIGGLNQALTGLDLEANTPNFHTGIGGAGMPTGIRAYHGSPHDFDEFDTSKIGTGEGAQAYGHGLYFAEHEPVAEGYRDRLSVMRNPYQNKFDEKWYVHDESGENTNGPFETEKHANDFVNSRHGKMYEVNIDAHPDHFLDWDKPLSNQSEHVQNALSEFPKNFTGDEIHQKMFHESRKELGGQGGGKEYSALTAKKLSNSGIKGIKYLDASSRGQGEGSRNYVVFDPKDIEIMRRYARGGDVRVHHASGGRTGYATIGGVPLSEDDQIEYARNLATGNDPMADAIQSKINSLSSNLNFEDVTHNPGMGGKSMLPGMASNISTQPITRSGADILRKDPALAANPPVMSKYGRPFHELEFTYVPKQNLVPWKQLDPETLFKENAFITPAIWDRTSGNTLVQSILGNKFSSPLNTQGGPDFQRSEFAQGENPAAAASRDAAVKGMMTKIANQNIPEGRPVYISSTLMGLPASDSSVMMAQALLRQIDPSKLSKSGIDYVNKVMSKEFDNWPGIENPQAVETLMKKLNVGAKTSTLPASFDTATAYNAGFPDVGASRFSITDPRLFSPEQLASGYSMSKIDLSKQPFQIENGHGTYPTKIPSVSGYEGGLKYQVPAEIMFSDWAKTLPITTKRGIPPTPTEKQQSLMSKMFAQEAHQEWLDNIMRHTEEHKKVWGYRKGGRTLGNNAIDNALKLAFGGDAEIEMPHSLKELQDWKKNHSHKAPSSMDDIFTHKMSGVEGANPIAMPANLDELLAYLRKHHAEGGRAHFDDGGDVRRGDSVGGLRGDTGGYSGNQGAANEGRMGNSPGGLRGDTGSYSSHDVGAEQGRQNEQTARDQWNQQNERRAQESNPDGYSVRSGNVPGGLGGDTGRYSGGTNAQQGQQDALTAALQGNMQRARQQQQQAFDKYMDQLKGPESGGQGSAYNPKTGAFGAYQLMPKTAVDLMQKYAPGETYRKAEGTSNPADVAGGGLNTGPGYVGLTPQEQLRNITVNQDLQRTLAEGLTRDNMATLANAGAPIDGGSLYTAHLLGAGDALKVLQSNPNTPLSETGVDPRAIANNRLEGLTAGQLLARSERQMAASSPSGVSSAGGYNRVAENTTDNSGARINDISGSPDAAVTAAKTEAAAPTPSIWNNLFGSTQDQIDKLAAEGKYAGMDKDQYTAKFSPNDPSAVKERIIYDNGQPKVDYYTKDLGQALFGDPLKALGEGVGNLFGQKQNYDPLTGQYRPAMNSSVGQEPSSFDNRGHGQDAINQAVMTARAPIATPAPYTTELGTYSQQLPSVGGVTAEQWAAANTGGDMSKVHGRITYVNGAPMLEYYTQ